MKNNSQAVIDFVTSEPKGGFVQIFLNAVTFSDIRQSLTAKFNKEQPILSWTGRATLESGVGTRVFQFENATIYNIYDKNSTKNIFLITEEDALALNIPRYVRKEAKEPVAIMPSEFFATA